MRTKCRSGLTGWTRKLRDNYDNDFEQFVAYSEMYGIASRLGFSSETDAWEANPQIRGSTIPSDLEVVK